MLIDLETRFGLASLAAPLTMLNSSQAINGYQKSSFDR